MATISRSRSKDSIFWLSIVVIAGILPIFFFNWGNITPIFQWYFVWILAVNEVSLIVLIGLLATKAHRKYKSVPWSVVIKMVIAVGIIFALAEFLLLAYTHLNPSH